MFASVMAGVPLPAPPIFSDRRRDPQYRSPVRLLAIVEGIHDAAFLREIASVLRTTNSELPDLVALEAAGRLVIVPRGGGDLGAWAERFAPLGLAEFHLADRELEPETTARRRAIERIESRSGCRAFLTAKKSTENYLHPDALVDAGGPRIEIGDDDPVAEILAERFQAEHEPGNS